MSTKGGLAIVKRMIALLESAICLAGLAAVSCSSASNVASGDFRVPNSMAVAGGNLLVANTVNDELRAIDLTVGTRRFVRAPNPLYPLSIPAITPREVAAFTDPADGSTAPLFFALSIVDSQVTVGSSKRLVELGSLATPSGFTPLSSTVTRFASGRDVQLVVAASQDTVPSKGVLFAAQFAESIESSPDQIANVQWVQKVDLGQDSQPQIVAASPTDWSLVAVGDRSNASGQGSLILCDLESGATPVHVDVGGPVKVLSFNASGTRLFGILDAEACEPTAICGGLFAVDIARDSSGAISVTKVPFGGPAFPGMPQGLAVSTVPQSVTLANDVVGTFDPLLVVSSSDSNIYLVDGSKMSLVDLNGRSSDQITKAISQADLKPKVTLTNELPIDQVIYLVWEGQLLNSFNGQVEKNALVESRDFSAAHVEVGDKVVFNNAGSCSVSEATISTIESGKLGLGDFDTGCLGQGPVSYSVRPNQAFSVSGSTSGLIGRVKPLGQVAVTGAVIETFEIPVASPLPRDRKFTIPLFTPYYVTTNGLTMPGAVVVAPKVSSNSSLFYVLFSGGPAVIELTPSNLRYATSDAGQIILR